MKIKVHHNNLNVSLIFILVPDVIVLILNIINHDNNLVSLPLLILVPLLIPLPLLVLVLVPLLVLILNIIDHINKLDLTLDIINYIKNLNLASNLTVLIIVVP